MTTTLARIIKYGLQHFGRNGWLSVATISVMVLALLMFEGLIVVQSITDKAIASLQDKIDISVYFKSNIGEDEILKVAKSLEGLAEVKSIEYISQDKALAIFQERHREDAAITAALEELGGNPLLASLNIKAHDPSKYSGIASYFEDEKLSSLVEKVTYSQNKIIIDRLATIIDTFEKAGLGITLFLAMVAALVTFNTIRIAIYSNREELNVMRLVGASNTFINGPYIVAGVLYGILAAILSFFIALPILGAIAPYVGIFIPELNLSAYMSANWPTFLAYQFLFGIVLGAVSTAIAVRRYLKI